MKAIIEVEFDPELMFDDESIKDDFGGDWEKAMKWLWEQEGLGIFSWEDMKLVAVSNQSTTKE